MIQEPGDRVQQLQQLILSLARDIDNTNCVPQERHLWLAHGLSDLVLAALEKFIDGQKEHGGNFEDVHGPSEALKEYVDTFFYLRKTTHPINMY